MPPLNALRAFEATARHLSFIAAASELAVTASAVSHQVALLERTLGVALFRRLNRAVRLTEAGHAMAPLLSEAFDRVAEAVARARGGAEGRTLNVTLSPGLAAKWLMPRIERFRARHKAIDLRIDASMRLVDFAREDAHVGLRYGRGNYPGLHAERLMSSEVFPVCAPALLRGRHPLRAPADLRHHTLIHDEASSMHAGAPDWTMWLAAAGVRDVDAARGSRFNSVALAVEHCLAGRGVLLATSVFVADDLATGRLLRPFAAALPADFAVYLVMPPASLELAKVRAFRDWVLEEVQGARRAAGKPQARARKPR